MSSPPLTVTVAGVPRVFCCHMATLSGRFAPNSLPAVKECAAASVPRLEIDVRFLADDSMLVFHDSGLAAATTGSGKVDALTRPEALALRYRSHPETPLCFLEDVVDVLGGSGTFLQVDLKLMRPISPRRVELLAATLAPLGRNTFVGSQAHWNLRPFAELGAPVAFDPTLQWHYSARERSEEMTPARRGVHGLWDDAPLAHIPRTTAAEYTSSRIADLVGLLPGAVEWMVDIATLRHLAGLGCDLGRELERHGMALAAWTMRDEGEARTRETMAALFRLGARTIITDDGPALARYAASGA
ncbi:MAG: hypothetical protein HY875_06295 [Chloroflexi bacterium]|nr:hypothetical protein [Chloroflexota bacterium]